MCNKAKKHLNNNDNWNKFELRSPDISNSSILNLIIITCNLQIVPQYYIYELNLNEMVKHFPKFSEV